MTVGDRIKQKRIELNLSQDELAKKVGYKSRSSIQKIESARNLPLPKVEKMALALECTPSYLMGWEDEDGQPTTKKELVDAYVQNQKASELFELYKNAAPEIQAAVDLLLKQQQPKT